jgi:hypothetical protein
MQNFRMYCLTEDDRIVRGADIEAIDLSEAIAAAREQCAMLEHGGHFEVWQGVKRLFASREEV